MPSDVSWIKLMLLKLKVAQFLVLVDVFNLGLCPAGLATLQFCRWFVSDVADLGGVYCTFVC